MIQNNFKFEDFLDVDSYFNLCFPVYKIYWGYDNEEI